MLRPQFFLGITVPAAFLALVGQPLIEHSVGALARPDGAAILAAVAAVVWTPGPLRAEEPADEFRRWAAGELPAMLIDHAQIHEQMRTEHVEFEVGPLDVQTGFFAHDFEQGLGQ